MANGVILTSPGGNTFEWTVDDAGALVSTPVVASPSIPSIIPAGTYNGMTKTQIIDLVKARTEHRADEKIDFNEEYVKAVMDFCGTAYYHWRRKTFSFYTQAGTNTYDLNSSYVGVDDFSQFSKVYLIDSTGVGVLDPIFDPNKQMEAIENTTPGKPSGYMPAPGAWQTIMFDCPVNGTYKISGIYYALPNLAIDDPDENVPLVPAPQQDCIVACMEKNVWAHLMSEGEFTAQYTRAKGEYEERVIDAIQQSRDFAVGLRKEYKYKGDEAVWSV